MGRDFESGIFGGFTTLEWESSVRGIKKQLKLNKQMKVGDTSFIYRIRGPADVGKRALRFDCLPGLTAITTSSGYLPHCCLLLRLGGRLRSSQRRTIRSHPSLPPALLCWWWWWARLGPTFGHFGLHGRNDEMWTDVSIQGGEAGTITNNFNYVGGPDVGELTPAAITEGDGTGMGGGVGFFVWDIEVFAVIQ